MKTTQFQSLFVAAALLVSGFALAEPTTISFDVPEKLVETGKMFNYVGTSAKKAFQSVFNAENGHKFVEVVSKKATEAQTTGKEVATGVVNGFAGAKDAFARGATLAFNGLSKSFADSKLYAQTVYKGGYNLENAQAHPEAFVAAAGVATLLGTVALYKLYKAFRASSDQYK